jgi:hypothetical protein
VVLVPFASVDLSALRWLRSGESPAAFSLLSGDRAIEGIAWAGSSGSLAHASTVDQRWSLKRVGFLRPHVTVRLEGASDDLARVTMHFGHLGAHVGDNFHLIRFSGGARYRFLRAGVQPPAWKVTTDDRTGPGPADPPAATEAQTELVHIEPVREGRKLVGAAVIVSEAGRDLPDLAAILAVVWYAIVLAWFEDEILLPFEEVGVALPARD